MMRGRLLMILMLPIAVGVIPRFARSADQPVPKGEFFIISSVNPSKQQILVKRPTEVTEVMSVDAGTKYLDRSGHAIALMDLRAGDTVYVLVRSNSNVALEIQRGIMTIGELQRRYLRSAK